MDFENQINEYEPLIILRKGELSFAIGKNKFLVANWDTHILKLTIITNY
jgi:hypothetical protein